MVMKGKRNLPGRNRSAHSDEVGIHDIEDLGKLPTPCTPTQNRSEAAIASDHADCNACAFKDIFGQPSHAAATGDDPAATGTKAEEELFEGRGMASGHYFPVYQQPKAQLPVWELKSKTKKPRWSREVADDVVEKSVAKRTTSGTTNEAVDCPDNADLETAKASFDKILGGACSSEPELPRSIDLIGVVNYKPQNVSIGSVDDPALAPLEQPKDVDKILLAADGDISETSN